MTLTLAELAPHDPITVSVASSTPFFTSTRSDLSANVTYTQVASNLISTNGGLQIANTVSYSGALQGSIAWNSTGGLSIIAITGSSHDFSLVNAANSSTVMYVATGMSYPYFPNSGNYGGVWGTVSDLRLKTDVKPLENGLDIALAIEIITHRWNELADCEDKETVFDAVSAQSVQKVAPTCTMVDHRGYLIVDYSKLSIYALAAIQQQQKQIDGLKSLIAKKRKPLWLSFKEFFI